MGRKIITPEEADRIARDDPIRPSPDLAVRIIQSLLVLGALGLIALGYVVGKLL